MALEGGGNAISFATALSRGDAVGPFGERPEAAIQGQIQEEGGVAGDVLDLDPEHPGRGPAVPAFSFARAEVLREADEKERIAIR
jgi:hypothetical protein